MKTFIQITKIKTVLLYIMQSFPKGVECAKLFRILYGIKEQIDTITNSYNKWLYLFHISSC